ncbi:hypothetical protein I503_03573 [Candida albicans SC5314]|nr:hypothetical protein MEK_03525 [Candida albicans 12C]KHC86561.1 hypothetical protein I503_03573 [Candida albicans SC5314]
MEQFYISSYIKFIWVIISHNSTSTSTSTQQSFKSFQQFNTKYGEFLQKLILDSQLSATNLMISLYYLYKHYHTNNVLLHDYCFDVLDEEDDDEEDDDEEEEDNELFNSMLIYNVIISLVLSNKSFDDQSFTLKTWLIIIDSTLNTTTITNNKPLINIDLKLLNYLENYFLSSLNFKLSFLDIAINPKFWKILSNSKIFSINQTILNKFKQLVMITNPTNIPTTTNTTTNQVTNVINNINLVFSPLPSTPISSSMTMLATTYNGINNNYKVVANSNTTITPFTNYSLTPAVVHVRDHIQGHGHSHTHSHARSISSNNNNNNFSSPLNNISTFSSPLNHPSTPSTPYYDDNYHVCLKRRRIMGAGSSGQVQPHYYLPPHPQPQQPMVLLPSQEFTFSQPMQYQYPPLPLPQPQQQHLDPMPVQAPVSMQSVSSISSFTQNSGSSNSNNSLINGMSIGMNSTSVVTTAASTVATADVQQQQQQHQQPMMMPYYPLQPQANSQQFNLF